MSELLDRTDTLLDPYTGILALFPAAEFERVDGVVRFRRKPLARWLADNVNLNQMWVAFHEGAFDVAALMQFYQDMGYSICGFCEVFGGQIDEMSKP